MASNQEDLQRRPVYLYDIDPQILNTIALKSDTGITDEPVAEIAKQTTDSAAAEPTTSGSQASCSLCGLKFDHVQEQRSHLKTDFHHYNLKQKLNGLEPVTEAKFEELVNNLDESISGSDQSDSEDEEEGQDKDTHMLSALLKKQANIAGKRAKEDGDDEEDGGKAKTSNGSQPLLWFTSPKLPENSYYGVYKAMLTQEELKKEDAIVDAIKSRQLAPITMGKPPKDANDLPPNYTGKHIFMCMIGGGHFAAMIIALNPRKTKHGTTGPLNKEAIVLVHKTFHRYTTRRKQGGSQSANDNAKGAAHSAGANLRRYNEQALVEDVRGLLAEWKGLIDTSELLFIRATGLTNRRTLFGPYDGQVLRANDPRIRGFPFMTRRATQNELMRAFIELTRLKVRQIVPEAAAPTAAESLKRPKSPKPAAASKPTLSEEEETLLLHTQQIQALVKRSKVPALLSYISTNDISLKEFRFFPADHHTPTPLHLAASQNSAALVTGLLTRAGADPTIPNGDGRTAFELAGDRAIRDAFRVARSELGEEKWDWEAAKVPVGLSRDEALKRMEREKNEAKEKEDQRRKAEEERLKKEGPKADAPKSGKRAGGSVLAAAMKLTPQERREEEAKGLTPEMKMRLERERRARAAEERIKRLQGGQ
ncbi:hypothetical protein B0T09DRAFT_288819 [Sordaria sp. MPI-SDFR-AT-0083]|nr:hypothetical protein B0T09DRAFT_288819 [Sordaria sp. MPI-SDFR-AT-0083]